MRTTRRTGRPLALTEILILAAIILGLIVLPVAASLSRAAPVAADDLGSWSCNPGAASVAFKADGFAGNLTGQATGLPGHALAILSTNVARREWELWLYPNDVTLRYSFDTVGVESVQPGGLPTGRINPLGVPTVAYHDGQLKAFYGQWGGDGNPDVALYRLNLACTFMP